MGCGYCNTPINLLACTVESLPTPLRVAVKVPVLAAGLCLGFLCWVGRP